VEVVEYVCPNQKQLNITPSSCETNRYDSSLTVAAVIVVSDFDVGKVYSTRIQKLPRKSAEAIPVARLIALWRGFSNLQQSGGHSSDGSASQ